MAAYAERTKVPVSQSKTEIERTLKRYGATGFLHGEHDGMALVGFVMHKRQIRFFLPLPYLRDYETEAKWQQEERRRWRSLTLAIKSKLEIVETGITDFESEFLAHIVMPDGKTVAQHALPAIEQSYETGEMPPLLPAPRKDGDSTP